MPATMQPAPRRRGRPPGWRTALERDLRATRAAAEWTAAALVDLDRFLTLEAELRAVAALLVRDPLNARGLRARAAALAEQGRIRRRLRLDPDHNARRAADVARQRERAAGLQADGTVRADSPLALLEGAAWCDERGGFFSADGLLALGQDLTHARALLSQNDPATQHRGRRSTRDVLDDEP